MASTTSGTTTFSMDVDEIIEEALKPLGGEHQPGVEASQIRRTLNLILIEMQNKNIPLNKLDFYSIPLNEDVITYTLDPSIVDVLQLNVKDNLGIEIPITSYSLQEYNTIPDKTTAKERPTLWTRQRLNDNVVLTFWPIPPNNNYTATMVVYKKIEDINASFQRLDLNTRYLPLIVHSLSYELSLHRQSVPQDIRAELKARRDEARTDAFDEDRERTDFYIRPGGIGGRQ